MAQIKEAQDLANYGWMMHLVGALIWFIIGAYLMSQGFHDDDLFRNDPEQAAGISMDGIFSLFLAGGFCIVMMLCSIVISFPIRWKILEPLQRQEYEFAARYLTLLRGPGLLFGFGMGGAFLFLSLMRLKDVVHETRSQTAQSSVAQATPICPECNTQARYVHGEQRWHCDRCARFL